VRLAGASRDRLTSSRLRREATLAGDHARLHGIDTEEIIATVHARRAPMMSATAGLRL
jgi:hypothetical protein